MARPVYFCPHCNTKQETFDYLDDTHFFSHCRVCGYPIEKGAVALGGVALHRRKLLFIDDDQLLLRLFADSRPSMISSPSLLRMARRASRWPSGSDRT